MSKVKCQMSDVRCQMSSGGVIALPSIILISILVLIAGIGISTSGFFESVMSSGDANSKKALSAAEAGAQDAFLRVVKNKLCNEGGSPVCSSYTLSLNDGVATSTTTITVSGSNPKTITSEGSVAGKTRKIQVTVSFDANNKATQTGWQELAN